MGQALAGETPVLLAVAPSAPCPLRTKEHLLCPGKKVVLGPKLAELSPVSVSLALEPPQLLFVSETMSRTGKAMLLPGEDNDVGPS